MAKPQLSPNMQSGLSELWARLRFVLLAIIIYRIGTHIPVPGINPNSLADMFNRSEGTILDMFNMFSGGALERMSILALGIILLRILTMSHLKIHVYPYFKPYFWVIR